MRAIVTGLVLLTVGLVGVGEAAAQARVGVPIIVNRGAPAAAQPAPVPPTADATGARTVVDDNLLAPCFGHLLADGAREHVCGAARGKADQHAYRFVRISLRERVAMDRDDAKRDGGEHCSTPGSNNG